MKVPFLNLEAHHAPLRREIEEAIRAVIDRSAFVGGSYVADFEEDFASYCECKFAIGVGSGTEALWLALLALGIGAGDEVITVASTFMATAEAITYCGAAPVFVDIDQASYTMDPSLLRAAITPRTKAIIPVHLFGQPADMDAIMEVAREHGLAVVEDACQAHGARYKGRAAGSIGDVGCFSFYPGKNLGAFGDAGAAVTNSPALNEKIRTLRDHGQERKYHHSMIGWNGRMDGIQGAVLKIKLRNLSAANDLRHRHAVQYDELLRGVEGISIPAEMPYANHVYHLYAIRVKDRDEVTRALDEKGIGYGIHYPIPVHLQQAYSGLGLGKGSLPITERCAQEFLSLPMFPELTEQQIAYVADTVKDAVGAGVTV